MAKPSERLEIVQERVAIPIGSDCIDGILSYPADEPPSAIAVVVGPHPLLGGDMSNNVVSGLADGLTESGMATLRFNYTGSLAMTDTGAFDPQSLNEFWNQSHTDDEAKRWNDLDAALEFMHSLRLSMRCYLAAYSFGNYVVACWLKQQSAALTRSAISPAGIACISPTVGKHDLSGLSESNVPKLVIAAADDFATDTARLDSELTAWQATSVNVAQDRDGHFFRGHESWLVTHSIDFFDELETKA